MLKLIAFFLLSCLILIPSAKSLRNWRKHGFFRTFAFEALLGMILLNVDHWFLNPFSIFQIISWISLIASLFLAIQGFYLLKTMGSPKGDIESTTKLVKHGSYKYIRHPLYCSLILLGTGVFFKNPSWMEGLLLLITFASLTATARVEERENLHHFGKDYRDYMQSTKMFIPFLF
jgi:protein-S-isoprenylcysteine O-methyltransferase Ste14